MKIIYYRIEKRKIADSLKRELSKLEEIKIAVLFGSVLKNSYIRDIDVAVYTVPKFTFKRLLLLASKLEERLNVPVDLVPLDELPPKMQYDILCNGEPIIVRDKMLYEGLIAQALGQIHDMKINIECAIALKTISKGKMTAHATSLHIVRSRGNESNCITSNLFWSIHS